MRVEAPALVARYAGAERRSGLVPPVPARSCAHTAVLARVRDGLPAIPGIRRGNALLPDLHPERHLSVRSIIVLRHSSVQRARGKWVRMRTRRQKKRMLSRGAPMTFVARPRCRCRLHARRHLAPRSSENPGSAGPITNALDSRRQKRAHSDGYLRPGFSPNR